jgi:NTE family protein
MRHGNRPELALVLGAGGTVGLAYHAGVLKALEDIGGVEVTNADLIIGTSAGSVAGACLRTGWTVDDMWQFALGTHPRLTELDPEERDARRRAMFTPTWSNPVDMVRRSLGSAFVATRSVLHLPAPPVPRHLGKAFPGGLCEMDPTGELEEMVGGDWPADDLWLCAYDLQTTSRVVVGKDGGPDLSLPKAVAASCSIPGFFRPVKAGRHVLVDGGVHSTTNLDLAADAGAKLIIGVAPMAYDPGAAPSPVKQLTRRMAARALSSEARKARAAGSQVLLLRPCSDELTVHGRNLMNPDAGESVARAAYECAARTLETERFQRTLQRQAA